MFKKISNEESIIKTLKQEEKQKMLTAYKKLEAFK